MSDNVVRLNKPKCPTCGRPHDERYRPFCSRRCADLDLGRWFRGAYAVPGEETPADGDGEEAGPGGPDRDDDDFTL